MRLDRKVIVFIRIILQQKGGLRHFYSYGLFDYRHGIDGVDCISVSGIAPGSAAGHGKLKGSSAAFARNVRMRLLAGAGRILNQCILTALAQIRYLEKRRLPTRQCVTHTR